LAGFEIVTSYPSMVRVVDSPEAGLIEELHGAFVDAVLRPHDHQPVALDAPLEQGRPMAQLIDGRPDVGTRRRGGQRRGIVRQGRGEQRFNRRPDPIDNGAQIWRLMALGFPQLFYRRGHGAALRVPHHHSEPRFEPLGRELDAADLRGCDDVAGHADDEQVTETLAEDELRRNAGIGAAENDGKRLLSRARTSSRCCSVLNEAPIALAQTRERLMSRDQALA
jgi:hypothetical protein